MIMGFNRDIGRKEILHARNIFMRYVLMLVVTYVGFSIMTSLLENVTEMEQQSIKYIEYGLVAAIFVVLGIILYKVILALRLFKKDREEKFT